MYTGFPDDSDGSKSVCKAGGPGLISGTGRFSREGNGSTHSVFLPGECHEKGAWQAADHGVSESQMLRMSN